MRVIHLDEVTLWEADHLPPWRGGCDPRQEAWTGETVQAFVESGMAIAEVTTVSIDEQRAHDALRQWIHRHKTCGARVVSRSGRLFLVRG